MVCSINTAQMLPKVLMKLHRSENGDLMAGNLEALRKAGLGKVATAVG